MVDCMYISQCNVYTTRIKYLSIYLSRHHVFLPGSLIGLRSVARSGWNVMSRGSDRLSGTCVIGFEARGTILLAMRLAV